MNRLIRSVVAAVVCAALPVLSHAAVIVFSDDFEDGNVSDWSVSSSAGVTVPVVTAVTSPVHSGTYAMATYFDAPSGGLGANFVRASHGFTAPAAGSYTLDLWARSAVCSGCTMYYDILVDGVSFAHTSAPSAFNHEVILLSGLSAGPHTLTLGHYTDAAFVGRFIATFDDVSITAVPEPISLALLGAGLAGLGFSRRRPS